MTVLLANAALILFYTVVFHSNKKLIVTLGTIQIFLVLALRANSYGLDAVYYMNGYGLISQFGFRDLLACINHNPLGTAHLVYPYSFENGWVILNWLFSRLGLDYHWFIVFTSAITAICFGHFVYKYSEDPGISLFVLCSMNFLLYSFFILRQTFALCICLESIPYILKKKPVQFCILMFLAISFHRSAILFAVLYPLAGMKLRKNTYLKAIIVFFTVLLVSVSILPIVLPVILSFFFKAHLDLKFEMNNLILLQLLIVACCCLFETEKIAEENSVNNLLLWALLASLISYAFMLSNEVLARSNEFLWIFVAPLIPLMLNRLEGHIRILATMFLVFLLFFYLIYLVHGSVYDPYLTCFA